jgi:hypothetical protein
MPDWVPGERLAQAAAVTAVASIADAPGTISAVLDTGPPKLVVFDGASASATQITTADIRPGTIRLYREGSDLQAFALSSATDREIIALDPASAFAETPSGVTTSPEHVLAGGREGASVWFRVVNDWTRARPSNGTWAEDLGPIADPQPSGAHHAAATTSDGSLYIGWSEDTGDVWDGVGAPFLRLLPGAAMAFNGTTRAGIDVDDSVSSNTLAGRGSGVVARYCGTDEDPLGVSSTDLLCYGALHPSGIHSTVKESSNVRYAFQGTNPFAAYCSAALGVRLIDTVATGTSVGALDARAGEIVAWPCTPIVAVEVDDDGEPHVILQFDGALYSPRPRVP